MHKVLGTFCRKCDGQNGPRAGYDVTDSKVPAQENNNPNPR